MFGEGLPTPPLRLTAGLTSAWETCGPAKWLGRRPATTADRPQLQIGHNCRSSTTADRPHQYDHNTATINLRNILLDRTAFHIQTQNYSSITSPSIPVRRL